MPQLTSFLFVLVVGSLVSCGGKLAGTDATVDASASLTGVGESSSDAGEWIVDSGRLPAPLRDAGSPSDAEPFRPTSDDGGPEDAEAGEGGGKDAAASLDAEALAACGTTANDFYVDIEGSGVFAPTGATDHPVLLGVASQQNQDLGGRPVVC
jgi:hypothetical protein